METNFNNKNAIGGIISTNSMEIPLQSDIYEAESPLTQEQEQTVIAIPENLEKCCQILEKANLLKMQFVQKFIDQQITDNIITNLTDKDLENIFPLLGQRVQFRVAANEILAGEHSTQSNGWTYFKNNVPLREILKATEEGKRALLFYSLHNKHSMESRKYVRNAIITYVLANKLKLDKSNFVYLSNEICNVFPRFEKAEFYFVAAANSKCGHSGPLYNHYRNEKRKLMLFEKANIKEEGTKKDSVIHNEQGMDELKNWLKFNTNIYNELVQMKWERTFMFRRNLLDQKISFADFLAEWPRFCRPEGYQYVISDFNSLFSNKGDNLKMYLPIYAELLVNVACEKAIQQKSKNLKGFFSEKSSSDDELFLTTLKAISFLIPPSIKNCTYLSAIDKIYNEMEADGNIMTYLNNIAEKYKQENIHFSPFIVYHKPKKIFYVSVHSLVYTFKSFLEALDVLFKSFFAFELEYPRESKMIFTFIQKAFFEINLKGDTNNAKLEMLLATYAKIKSEAMTAATHQDESDMCVTISLDI